MITFSHTSRKGVVYVRCSENKDEENQLKVLASEVRMICNMTKKTGLWIVDEFEMNSAAVIITSLERLIEIENRDIEAIKEKLRNLTQGK